MQHYTFTEGNLKFTFSSDWDVIKYDAHRYYRSLSGSSFSGVDFAGIYRCDQAVFIEVKNYLQYDGPIRDSAEILIRKFGEKITDTIRLIDIAHRLHHRKWWYRTFISWILKYPWLHRDWYFWTRLYTLSQHTDHFKFIFYIVCREEDVLLFEEVQHGLDKLQKGIHTDFVFSRSQISGVSVH